MRLAGCVGWVHCNVEHAPCPNVKLTNVSFEHAHAWWSATWDVMAAQNEMLLAELAHMKSSRPKRISSRDLLSSLHAFASGAKRHPVTE